jgi:RHS repeat-associated protein
MGNIANYTQTVNGSTTVDQDRASNTLNQITSLGSAVTPGYDADGDMTTVPQPGNHTVCLTCTYDAWHDLISVYNGSTLLAWYTYDGLHRRITETAGGQTRVFFFDGQQDIEERLSSSSLPLGQGQGVGSGESFQSSASIIAALPANIQYVWGLRGPSDLVLRDRAATTSGGDLGVNGSGLNERLYALQDANWNVIALVNTSGTAVERYTYTAFGVTTVLNPNCSVKSSGTAYGWTVLFGGYSLEPFTGLYKSHSRIYDAYLASFVTTDPIPNPNLYWYCNNNPVNDTDPTGAQVATRWAWDANLQTFFDPRTGRTQAEAMAIDAAKNAAEGARCAAWRAQWLTRRQNIRNARSGFWNSVGNSFYSMGQTYWAMGQVACGDGNANTTFQEASDRGIFGQTEDAPGWCYYGTRGAVGVATAAGLTASALMVAGTGGGLASLNEATGGGGVLWGGSAQSLTAWQEAQAARAAWQLGQAELRAAQWQEILDAYIESGEANDALINSAQAYIDSANYDADIAMRVLQGMRVLLGQ